MINTPKQVEEIPSGNSERGAESSSIATSFEDLTQFLGSYTNIPVRFLLDGHSINPGYHVTEIKYSSIQSIDCGHGKDEWNELIIQLLDGKEHANEGFMSSTKLLTLITAASNSLPMTSELQLYFEYAPRNGAMMKLAVESLNHVNDASSMTPELHVVLETQRVVCKPFQRSMNATSLVAQGAQSEISPDAHDAACCGGSASTVSASCCGSKSAKANIRACC